MKNSTNSNNNGDAKTEFSKSEAAAYINVSPRTLQRYTASRLIVCRDERDENGRKATIYTLEDLKELRKKLDNGSAIKTEASLEKRTNSATEISRVLSEAIMAFQQRSQTPSVTEKLTLDMRDASMLSGLSVGFLQRACRDKKLKTIKGCRGYRVSRSALEKFIARA